MCRVCIWSNAPLTLVVVIVIAAMTVGGPLVLCLRARGTAALAEPRHRGRGGIGESSKNKDHLGLRALKRADPRMGLQGAPAVLCLPTPAGKTPV